MDIPASKDRLEPLAKEMSERYGVKVVPLYCDVSDEEQVKALKDDLIRELGTVDFAHINAGVCLMGDDVDVPYSTWKKIIDIDLNGAFMTAQVAQQIMREHNHGGSIIMTSLSPVTMLTLSAAARLRSAPTVLQRPASLNWARYMGAGLAPYGIRVNTISPGYIWSGIHEGVMDKAGHDMCLEVVPIKRFGRTDELQGVMLFLASEASSYITGINIPVDGGYSIF